MLIAKFLKNVNLKASFRIVSGSVKYSQDPELRTVYVDFFAKKWNSHRAVALLKSFLS